MKETGFHSFKTLEWCHLLKIYGNSKCLSYGWYWQKGGAGIKSGVGYLAFRTKDAEGLFDRKSEDLSLLLDPEAEGGLEAADEEPVTAVGQLD